MIKSLAMAFRRGAVAVSRLLNRGVSEVPSKQVVPALARSFAAEPAAVEDINDGKVTQVRDGETPSLPALRAPQPLLVSSLQLKQGARC